MMHPTPHLLKSIRKNLFKHNIFFDNSKQASWQDIRYFYSLDSKQNFKLAPKLTQKNTLNLQLLLK
jgi:hypothetical protein